MRQICGSCYKINREPDEELRRRSCAVSDDPLAVDRVRSIHIMYIISLQKHPGCISRWHRPISNHGAAVKSANSQRPGSLRYIKSDA